MSARRNRLKESRRRSPRGRAGLSGSAVAQTVTVQIPRPQVTEYNIVTVVPVLPSGKSGPPSGSRGRYDVAFVLGVPGVGGVSREIKESATGTIRNAVAHLMPGRDVLVADYLKDIQACRDIVPVLRYMSRTLISDEIAALCGPPPKPLG